VTGYITVARGLGIWSKIAGTERKQRKKAK